MKKKLRPPVKVNGSKSNLANWIIENFPSSYEQLTFVEPMCAGASVFLNKNPSSQEVLNDLDKGFVYIFKALRDEPKEFIDRVKRTRLTERTFKKAQAKIDSGVEDYIDFAVNEYFLRRLSRNGAKKIFVSNEKGGEVSSSQNLVQELNLIAERVKNCTILNTSVFDILKVWDEEDTLWYLDPPPLPNPKEENTGQLSDNGMSVEDHIQLLALAKNARGKVVISGFSSPLYNRTLKGWKTKKKNMANASQERKMEVLWMNY